MEARNQSDLEKAKKGRTMNVIDRACEFLDATSASDPSRPIIMDLLDEIERMIGLADRAAQNERAACLELAARYGGRDADEIAEMIGARSFAKQ